MFWGTPYYIGLFWIVLAGLLFFYMYVFKVKKTNLAKFANKQILANLVADVDFKKQRTKAYLISIAILLVLLALARPQIGTKLTFATRKGIDIIVAIDTSKSMLAEDMKPNRLEKAKMEVMGLIDRLKGDRIGIIAFAGTSFVQCPLTLDYSAAKMFLDIIDENLIPKPGTAIGSAIRKATASFNKQERKHKVLILVTDGEDHKSRPIDAAEDAAKEGVNIYTIGIGSSKGEPIPIRDANGNVTGFKKDRQGNVVTTKLDELTLQKIALLTDGKYYHATGNEIELDKIYKIIDAMDKKELKDRFFTQHEDRFQFVLFIAIVLLCIEFVLGDKK